MFNIGPQELLLILLVALVIVGPKRLPELSRTIGRGLREFRKAQDEVSKTIRLGLDETEPTAKPVGRTAAAGQPGPQTAPPDSSTDALPDASEPPTAPEPDEAADIARTLGRGLAEIRRARQEIQRTFRVDLSDEAPRPARRAPATPSSTAPTAAPVPSPSPADGTPAEPGTDG